MYINSTHQPLNLLLYLFREPKAAASCLEQLLRETKPSRQTGHIIGSLLMRTKTFNLSLRSLVEWPLWPPILKAYSKLRDCIAEIHMNSLCKNVLNILLLTLYFTFENVIQKSKTATFIISDLLCIFRNLNYCSWNGMGKCLFLWNVSITIRRYS